VAFAGNEDNDRPPGPDPLEADTWGVPPVASTSADYSGRHHTASSRSRRRLAIAAGVVGVVAVIAISMLLGGSPAPAPPAVAIDPERGDRLPPSSAPQDSAGVNSAGVSSSASPTAVPTTNRPVVPTVKPTPKPPPVKPFPPLTFEAEAGMPTVTLGGSAWVDGYDGASNGKIARNVGDWGMRGGPGSVRFNGVTFPTSATYVLAISYVHPDNEPTRSAQIAVSGLDAVTVTFDGSSKCCAIKKISLVIPAGTHTITISNSRDRAPAIDKIVISAG
jgi:hypothetical protein